MARGHGLIRGSPTCADVRYLSVVRDELISSTDIQQILRARYAANAPIEVDHTAISHLLHDGFVPPPRTAYRDVFAISVDLSARLAGSEIVFERDYPFTNDKSPCNGQPSTRALLEHLAQAITTACKDSRDALLMLSSGVDSTSLAVAAKEAARDDLICVSYGEPENDFEVNFARATCKRLGLRHEAHILDLRSPKLQSDLINYAATVPEPCADPALTACISAVARFAGPGTAVLDGSGSDYYFWRPPRLVDLMKTWLGFGKIQMLRRVRNLLPMHYRRERIFATPLELLLLHGAWLRFCDTSRFYPAAVDTQEHWLDEFLNACPYEREEMPHCIKMVYMGPAAYMLKTRNAALSVDAIARFPWSDGVVADYCFNLPESARFERKRRKSKIIVRQMLSETIDYQHDLVGKRYFSFGKHNFLRHHLEFCRDQILACTLWSPAIERTFDGLAGMLARGYQIENALLSLLMVSLWHNHWINGSMMDSLRTSQHTSLIPAARSA